MTGEEIFNEYQAIWKNYQNSRFKRTRAFIKKAIQKIIEK